MIQCSHDRKLKDNNRAKHKVWNSWKFVKLLQVLFALVISIPIILLLTSSHNKTWTQKTIHIASDTRVFTKADSVYKTGDSKEALLLEMEKEGVLFTAEEFASHITSYYNTLVAVLGVMVAFFTIASFFLVNNFFKNEFEREKLRIIKELDSDTIEKIKRLLRDSIETRDAIIESIRGKIEGDFVSNDYFDKFDQVIKEIMEKQKDIELQLRNLQELYPSKLSVIEDEPYEGDTSKEK